MTVESVQSVPEASVSPFSRAWRWWEKAGSVLAIFGLADLFGQFVKWAGIVHWLVSQYAAAKAWVFSWLPFHIPPEWHDPIVLLLVLFTVTNLGFYRRTGRTYAHHLLVWARSLILLMLMWPLFPLAIFSKRFRDHIAAIQGRMRGDEWLASDPMAKKLMIGVAVCFTAFVVTAVVWLIFDVRGIPIGPEHAGIIIVALMAANMVFAGGAVAWRWILGTAAAFAAIVAINQIYVWWLAPLAGN